MKISYAVFCLKKKNEIAALAASERRDADLDRLFAALSTMRFFFNDTATTEIYTLSLHDALPICNHRRWIYRSGLRLIRIPVNTVKAARIEDRCIQIGRAHV